MPVIRNQANASDLHDILVRIGCALARQAARDDDAAEQRRRANAPGGSSCVVPSMPASRRTCRTSAR